MIIAHAGKTVKQKRKDLLFYRHYGMILIETPAQKGENQNRRMKLMQYEIKGGSMPVVVCTLQNGESIKTEKGAMSWMSPRPMLAVELGKHFLVSLPENPCFRISIRHGAERD